MKSSQIEPKQGSRWPTSSPRRAAGDSAARPSLASNLHGGAIQVVVLMMPEDFFTVGLWLENFSPTCLFVERLPDVELKRAMSGSTLPVGKLPAELLAELLGRLAPRDSRVIIGPGMGLDCSVVRVGQQLLVFKSDPITFATKDIGYYLVRVNANDLATTGAQPRWLLVTILLPEHGDDRESIQHVANDIDVACREIGVEVIGGHTEITHGLYRPILVGTLVGEVEVGRFGNAARRASRRLGSAHQRGAY